VFGLSIRSTFPPRVSEDRSDAVYAWDGPDVLGSLLKRLSSYLLGAAPADLEACPGRKACDLSYTTQISADRAASSDEIVLAYTRKQ